MTQRHQDVVLVGFGAIGQAVAQRLVGHDQLRITHVVVRPGREVAVQDQLDALAASDPASAAHAVSAVPPTTTLLLECAGPAALVDHVLPALKRGFETAVLSVGALSEPGLPEALEAAAQQGQTQLHLLSGAIGGIDAIASARLMGIDELIYTGRKPPLGWRGSPAEAIADLAHLTSPLVIFQASAREAARLYPKNANVAATLALASVGLDHTQVRLVADPGVSENIHEFEVRGAFGEMRIQLRGKPLADNPKTSTLTVLSALRFLYNRVASVTT
jgi:aspartate dehydrogenase